MHGRERERGIGRGREKKGEEERGKERKGEGEKEERGRKSLSEKMRWSVCWLYQLGNIVSRKSLNKRNI